jgi:hypothetical protein
LFGSGGINKETVQETFVDGEGRGDIERISEIGRVLRKVLRAGNFYQGPSLFLIFPFLRRKPTAAGGTNDKEIIA